MTFPQTPLDIRTEFLIDGVWETVPTYERDTVVIEHGRPERATTTDPGSLQITVNNRDGTYSPRNPMSPLYGKIGRNTRCRLSVPGTESYLELTGRETDYASTPDHPSLDITGDLDLRWEGEADWYAPGAHMLIGKWSPVAGERSYHMHLEDGNLWLIATTNGTIGVTAWWQLPVLPRRAALRTTLQTDNDAGEHVFRFYWSESLDGPWIKFTDDEVMTAPGTVTIFNGPAPLVIAPWQPDATPPRNPVVGRCYRAEVRAGLNGTIAAAPDFTVQPEGTTSFTDSAGRTWTLSGAAQIRDRHDLFVGEVSEWPQHWTPDGTDAWVTMEASGILRRMGQGKKALQSTLRRSIPRYTPLAYWPMEEGQHAVQAYSPLPGVPPMTVTGVDWASVTTLPSSEPLPALRTTGGVAPTLYGQVPAPATAISSWSVDFVYYLDKPPASLQTFLRVLSTGTVRQWLFRMRDSLSNVTGLDADGNVVFSQNIGTSNNIFGQWIRVRFWALQDGGNVRWRIDWVDVKGEAGGYTTSFAGTVGRPTAVASPDGGYSSELDGLALGHISVWPSSLTFGYVGAINAWTGETARERMRRLATEEGVLLAHVPGPQTPEQVGYQTPDTLLSLLQSAADADGGLLLEDRTRPGLVYRERSSMYAQEPKLVLSYDKARGLAAPLTPVDDDTTVRNDRTVQRAGGSAGRAVLEDGPLSVQDPPNGVGLYDDSVTLSLHDDAQTLPIAHWRLHLGTHDGPRYPQVKVLLHKAPELIPQVLGLMEGDLIRITDLPPQVGFGDVDLLIDGIRHEMSLQHWTVTLTCSPGEPWQVGVVSDPVFGHVDTDGSELWEEVDETATQLTVAITDGPEWAIDSPFNIRVGGEVMTVTGISGINPQTFWVVRSVNGVVKAHPAGAPVRLADPATIAL